MAEEELKLVLKLGKSLDLGVTWDFTLIEFVKKEGEDELQPLMPSGYSDPNGRIWIVFWLGDLTDPPSLGSIYLIHSDDDGESWTDLTDPDEIIDGVRLQKAAITMDASGTLWVSTEFFGDVRYWFSHDYGTTWDYIA